MHIQKPNPGYTCLVCRTGKLQARTRSQSTTNREVIGGPVFPTYHYLTELVCGACGAKFEPQSIEQSIEENLENQLILFRNPDVKPEQCPNCNSKQLASGRVKTQPDAFPVGSSYAIRQTHNSHNTNERYLYCRYCIKILWNEPPTEKPTLPTNTVAELEEDLRALTRQEKKPVRRTLNDHKPKSRP